MYLFAYQLHAYKGLDSEVQLRICYKWTFLLFFCRVRARARAIECVTTIRRDYIVGCFFSFLFNLNVSNSNESPEYRRKCVLRTCYDNGFVKPFDGKNEWLTHRYDGVIRATADPVLVLVTKQLCFFFFSKTTIRRSTNG